MNFLLLFGPQAVGKMTVGHELEKNTDLKLFHNHMTIDLVMPFFDYSDPEGQRLVELFRNEIFHAVAKSDLPGIIFTFVWAFDVEEDHKYIEKIVSIFKKESAEIFYVELEASLNKRLDRNKTPHRLKHKPGKKDIDSSEKRILASVTNHRTNSRQNEISFENYLRIDNSEMRPLDVARKIKSYFSF